MELDKAIISKRALSKLHEDEGAFKFLPRVFSYLLSKHEDDGFSGCDEVRLAVVDSFESDTRTLVSKESVVIFDLSVAHGCDNILSAFIANDFAKLHFYNRFIFRLVEKHLYDNGEFHCALWLYMCNKSLYFSNTHGLNLKGGSLQSVASVDDVYFAEVKLKALILSHEIRHHLISRDSKSPKPNGMLRTWIELVEDETFPELDEREIREVVESTLEELICDYAAISYLDDFDWDLQTKSKSPNEDFYLAMSSLALFFDISAHLMVEIDVSRSRALRLRSAVLRRSTHMITGPELFQTLSQKYEILREHAFNIIDALRTIRNFTPIDSIANFVRPELALEYFNGYKREESEEWESFLSHDIGRWYDEVASYSRDSGNYEYGLWDKICEKSLEQPWLNSVVGRIFEKN